VVWKRRQIKHLDQNSHAITKLEETDFSGSTPAASTNLRSPAAVSELRLASQPDCELSSFSRRLQYFLHEIRFPFQATGSQHRAPNAAAIIALMTFASATKAYMDRWVDNLKRNVPNAGLVDLPAAGHYVFLTREAEVLKELRKFVAGL